MNSSEQFLSGFAALKRLAQWPLVCFSLVLVCARLAGAADAYYINNAVVNYPLINQYPPVIDASNFVNNSSFTINFQTFTVDNQFYENVRYFQLHQPWHDGM